jgi:hypothetical protein
MQRLMMGRRAADSAEASRFPDTDASRRPVVAMSAPLRMQVGSPRPISTNRILTLKALERSCGQECVDWAIGEIERGRRD